MRQQRTFRDAIFIVTQERLCPIYNVGEEIKVEQYSVIVPAAKPACLLLVEKLIEVTTKKQSFERFSPIGVKRSSFQCGGCQGLITFEYKKEKGFATVQMKLMNEAEAKRKRQELDRFFGRLRDFPLFESLDDDALSDLTALMEWKKYGENKVVLKEGEPGTHLFIMLKGKVGVIAEDGSKLAEIERGAIFGEMSLLSGEPVSCSIHSLQETEVATLSIKNFKFVLKKYPVLQLFLLKMLVDRAQAMTLRAGHITSGMSGELDEINLVELFQLINVSQKTGTIDLTLDDGKAVAYFNEGELIEVRYRDMLNKEALFALMAQQKGHFAYSKGIPGKLQKKDPFGGFMGLIMEGVQRIDEEQYG